MQVLFTPAAQAEVIEAETWYEAEASSLGKRLRAEIDALVARISANPLQFPVIFQLDVRRALLRKFPYGLFFRVDADAAVIIACFHSRQDPRIWQDRV
jgi:plasmid stabilization system protein ParE